MSGLVNQTYSVKMIPYSKEAVDRLKGECMFREAVSKKRLLNIASAFDTETSSFIDDQTYEKSAYCYIWMFGIEDTVVYGRYLDEFAELVHLLDEFLKGMGVRLITYVHFLKFDFSFIKGYIQWDNVFLKKNRDVLFADVGNIEFRDSLVLAGGNGLAKVGKNLRNPVQKAVGDMDYSLVRHSKTPLTDKEMHYCEMDIRVLVQYIREKIEDDGDISKIPYTNTGYVRRYVREACFENRRAYSQFMDGLTMTPRCAEQAMDCFAGGSVFGNLRYIGKVCEQIQSYDIKSSYPYVMCCCYFPINYFTPVAGLVNQTIPWGDFSVHAKYLDNSCCMFELELWDVEPLTEYYFPISKHKCHDVIAPVSTGEYQESASGRIISAMYLKLSCTELDLDTIRKFYKCSKYRITDMRISPRGYLPRPIVKSIAKFFNGKTTLDGVDGMEREYMISKNMLNSIYGMMVEKVIRDILSFDNVTGFAKEKANIVRAVVEWNEKRNRFLFYPWGVWVTAHARWRLHDAIYHIGEDFRYCDTDSVKFVGNHDNYFSLVNQTAKAEVEACARRNGIAIDFMIPKSPKGDRKILGVWEKEWEGAEFKTLGAKRYLIHFPNGKRHKNKIIYWELTVAGTNKEHTLEFVQKEAKSLGVSPFDVFTSELVVPEEYAKRTVSTFFDDERRGWITDYLGNRAYYVAKSGIHVAQATYSFSITDEMRDAVIWLTHDGYYQDGAV